MRLIDDLFYLDWKGIIPTEKDTFTTYTYNGPHLLNIAESEMFVNEAGRILSKKYIGVKRDTIDDKILTRFNKRFNTDISWVKAFKGRVPSSGVMTSICYNGLWVPVVIKSELHFSTAKSVYTHELIHAVRNMLPDNVEGFEEAYAMRFDWLKYHSDVGIFNVIKYTSKIKKAEKKLEDVFGHDAPYVSLRLSGDEILDIADTSGLDIKAYLKARKCLRHFIILERFGL
ncbi:hypothetical protein FJZ53_00295 [Candidatus Woesearchaeota archaeon]|nr:hypothetical protein [Candidatus Woesearchaeota archaeon]